MNLMKSNNEEEKELILLKMDGFLCTYLNLNTGEIEYSLAECFPEVEKDLKLIKLLLLGRTRFQY